MSENERPENQLPSASRTQSVGTNSQPSLKQLVARTISDGKRLLTAQVNLTSTELSHTGKRIGAVSVFALLAVSLFSLGGLFILIALAYALVAAGLPIWAGFLIVALVLIVIGIVFAAVARSKGQKIKGPSLASQEWKQTTETLAQLNNRKPF